MEGNGQIITKPAQSLTYIEPSSSPTAHACSCGFSVDLTAPPLPIGGGASCPYLDSLSEFFMKSIDPQE